MAKDICVSFDQDRAVGVSIGCRIASADDIDAGRFPRYFDMTDKLIQNTNSSVRNRKKWRRT